MLALLPILVAATLPAPTKSILTYEIGTVSVIQSSLDCELLGTPSYGCWGKSHQVELKWSSRGGPLHIWALDNGYSLRLWVNLKSADGKKSCSSGFGNIEYATLDNMATWAEIRSRFERLANECGVVFDGTYTPLDEFSSAITYFPKALDVMKSASLEVFGSLGHRCLEEASRAALSSPHAGGECVRYSPD